MMTSLKMSRFEYEIGNILNANKVSGCWLGPGDITLDCGSTCRGFTASHYTYLTRKRAWEDVNKILTKCNEDTHLLVSTVPGMSNS